MDSLYHFPSFQAFMDNSRKPYIYSTHLVKEYNLFSTETKYYEQTVKREIVLDGFLSAHSPPYSPINSPPRYIPMNSPVNMQGWYNSPTGYSSFTNPPVYSLILNKII